MKKNWKKGRRRKAQLLGGLNPMRHQLASWCSNCCASTSHCINSWLLSVFLTTDFFFFRASCQQTSTGSRPSSCRRSALSTSSPLTGWGRWGSSRSGKAPSLRCRETRTPRPSCRRSKRSVQPSVNIFGDVVNLVRLLWKHFSMLCMSNALLLFAKLAS